MCGFKDGGGVIVPGYLQFTGQIALAGNNGLCRQKLAQDYSFKMHLFLQNVLENLVRSTSK